MSDESKTTAKPKRKSTGKRLRFEVFKRDNFTCQYCGAQPPEVVLVVDHIKPVASGGTNDPMNLITACEPCNQGKADRELGDRIIRPDADLMYLETQQEIAEMDRYMESLRAKEERIEHMVSVLASRWFIHDTKAHYAPRWLENSVRQMLQKFDPASIDEAIAITAGRVDGGYLGYGEQTARYLYAVARNLSEEEGGD